MGLTESNFSPEKSRDQPGGSLFLDRMLAKIKAAMDKLAQGLISNLSETRGVWTIKAGPAAPVGNPPPGQYYEYIDPLDGKRKCRGSNGTITILGTP